MALYIRQSILHLARSLYVRPETYGPTYVDFIFFPLMAQEPLVSQDLLIYDASQSHSGVPHSVGLPLTCYQPNAQTST